MLMKLKIAICDDEQKQIEYITALVTLWSAKEGHSCEIRAFESAEAFLFEYEDDKAYDILLLDVEMKNITGIELAKRIRKDNNRAEIVFITSHFEFVGEGYEVDALHYLVKPISEDKLSQVLTKAAEKGFAKAQCDLGALYLFGKGVPVDAKKALSLYQKAAEQGNDVAMVSLGMMYYRGMGVSQNSEEAIKWWKKARKKGNENAILILKKILENK